MFYFLTNKKRQSVWAYSFDRLYSEALNKIGIETKTINSLKCLSKLTEKDYLFICQYQDIDTEEVRNCKAIKLAQVNGTGANLYCPQVKQTQEKKEVEKILNYNVVFNKRHEKVFKSVYPNAKTIIAGFPVAVNLFSNIRRKKKKIVVAGRVSPDKQFYLATYLLKDLLKLGYEIVFCYNTDKDKEWLELYDYNKFKKIGFKFKKLNHNNFIKELQSAEYYFICSLGDTMSVSLAEALLCGCKPIVPDLKEGIPVYDDYIFSNKYKPFCKESVKKIILKNKQYRFNLAEITPEYCANQLKQFLNL